MMTSGAVAYRKTQVTTSSPVQLVIQLYEGAVRFAERGIQAIQLGDLEAAHLALVRSQEIITELRATLNPEAGEIAQNLSVVYGSMYEKLVLANVRKDPAPARETVAQLRELLSAWRSVASEGQDR